MQIKSTLNHILHNLIIGILGLSTLSILAFFSFFSVKADNPTFFFSNSSGCDTSATNLDAYVGNPQTLYVCIDADNEGKGLLGAEINITYSASTLSVSNILCNVFDTCINLSEPGIIKLLAASGPLPDGQAATTQRALGTIVITPKSIGSSVLSFNLAQVINENEQIENRNGIGLTLNVLAEIIPEEEVPVSEAEVISEIELTIEEVPLEEVFPAEEIPAEVELPPVAPEDTEVSSVVVSPLADTAIPGSSVQIISKVNYTEGRVSENITSCFPCPTPNNSANGTTTYNIVSGPGTFTGSKVFVSPSATPGQIIRFNADYADNVSGTSGLSGDSTITVVATTEEITEEPVTEETVPGEEPVTEETVPGEEPVTEETVPDEEPVTEDGSESEDEGEVVTREAAPAYQSEAEKALKVQPAQENSDANIPTVSEIEEKFEKCSLSSSNIFDSDQDGLSDRTECYMGTDQINPDTDGDGCWDGEEINRLYSNPLTSNDCNIQEALEKRVFIFDPKPNWILKSFEIAGTTPIKSQRVGVTAIPTLNSALNPVIVDLEGLIDVLSQAESETQQDVVFSMLTEIALDLQNLNDFVAKYGNEYEGLNDLMVKIRDYMTSDVETIMGDSEYAQILLEALRNYQFSVIFLGEVTNLKEIGIGQSITAGFHLIPDAKVTDGVYDLIATAFLNDGEVLSSAPVRVILDSTSHLDPPNPQSLDDIPILENSGIIKVENGRPVLAGKGTYGSQIFATWESLVLASSIIADSNEGSFGIQSPRELEVDQDHTVSIYAVSQQEAGMVRSESVIVDFSVKKKTSSVIYWVLGILALLALAAATAKKRMVRIDHVAPEHREKENELYEAFGLEILHQEEVPKGHSDKEKEIEEAFKNSPLE